MAAPSDGRGSGRLLVPLTGGLLLGGSASALGLWVLSGFAEPVWPQVRVALLVILALAALAEDALGLGWRWPQNARQVPQNVRRRDPRLGLLQFGFELGTGMRTYVTSRAPYVVVGLLLLGGLPATEALATGIGFGAGRALMPVTRTLHPSAGTWDAALERAARPLKVTAVALAGCAAVWLAVNRVW